MQIKLCYIETRLGDAFRTCFHGEKDVEIVHGSILDCGCDAIVSPANSFGFMDGGLDWDICDRFGWHIQDRVRELINNLTARELLVGSAMLVETGDPITHTIVVAPTMRVPMSFNIYKTVNAYLAMKAALLRAARKRSKIKSLAIPGLCTGVGKMPPGVAARQMWTAYREVVHGDWPQFDNCVQAQSHQLKMNPNGKIHG